jgi:hypothetical protein
MPIASPWRGLWVPRSEKIIEIEIALAPGFMIGQVVEVEGEPLIVVGIVNRVGGFSTTRLRAAEPNWLWKLRYKTRRLLRRVWLFITKPFQRRRG